eukprot:g15760.t1
MDDVERILLEDLGLKLSDLFESFDPKPIAAASIAQVHAARLRSGELCVVKVVRPHVRERLSADFAAATLFARLADLVLGEDLVLQMSRVLTMERIEGVPFSDICANHQQDAPENWQNALTSALSVAALSVIDGTAIFHEARKAKKGVLPKNGEKARGEVRSSVRALPTLCSASQSSALARSWMLTRWLKMLGLSVLR